MRSDRPTRGSEGRGSGGAQDAAEPRFIAIGRIIRPHGVRGDTLVDVFTDFPERFKSLRTVYVGDALQAQLWRVRQARWHNDRILLSLEGCEDRTRAEQLRGLLVQIPVEEAMPLPEDEYYPHQLVGLDVVTREGEELGRLSEVVFTNANEIYVVAGPRGQILLPAIADVIDRVDLEEGYILVNLIDGLI